MRILINGINFAPELTGIGKYSGEMAAYLAEKGHEVRVVTAPPYYPQWGVLPGYSPYAYRKEVWQGVTVYRCPLWVPDCSGGGRLGGIKRILHLASFALSSMPVTLAQAAWRPERVIVLAPSIFNAPVAWLTARLAGGKAWLHIQDFELDAARQLNLVSAKDGFFYRVAQAAETTLYRSFDHVSTISNRMLELLWKKGEPRERTSLFPNWVDTRLIYPIPGYNPLRRELGIEDNCRVVLYSGNMGQKQGLEVLVEAARILQDKTGWLFLLCGEGAARSQLEALAAGMANVRFLPLQPLERLNELLNLADIHVLPQSSGAADLVMPSKLGGMLASGKPVIATACLGTELANVVATLGVVILPGRPDLLAEAIRDLGREPQRTGELGQRSLEFVKTTWERDIVLEQFQSSLMALE